MVNIILNGCCGRMGRMVTQICSEDDGVRIVAGIDPTCGTIFAEGYFVYKDIQEFRRNGRRTAENHVVIDFSSPSCTDQVLDFCAETGTAVVLCTTGLSDAQLQHVEKASETTAVLRSANMSMGINLLQKLLKEAAPILAEAGFDIEILEKHHNRKADAPSGTALALADTINGALDRSHDLVYARTGKRNKDEIGISSIRGGTIVGDHDVIFAGTDEVITLSHSAQSRAVFAKGAVQAAKFLIEKPNGIYTMSDVLEGR